MTLFGMSITVQLNFIVKTCGRNNFVNFEVRITKFFVYLQNSIPQLFAQAIFSKNPLKNIFPQSIFKTLFRKYWPSQTFNF